VYMTMGRSMHSRRDRSGGWSPRRAWTRRTRCPCRTWTRSRSRRSAARSRSAGRKRCGSVGSPLHVAKYARLFSVAANSDRTTVAVESGKSHRRCRWREIVVRTSSRRSRRYRSAQRRSACRARAPSASTTWPTARNRHRATVSYSLHKAGEQFDAVACSARKVGVFCGQGGSLHLLAGRSDARFASFMGGRSTTA